LEIHPNSDNRSHSGNGISRAALDMQEEYFFKRAAALGFDRMSRSLSADGISASKVHAAF
jgi:hypothetical protein